MNFLANAVANADRLGVDFVDERGWRTGSVRVDLCV
jgi:hypothetical protein